MASLTMARALTGARAFKVLAPGQAKAQRWGASNGAFATMRKKDSYMVEVEVGEDEPEDVAVRRFMKQVVQSKVVEKLRARRVLETKIEAYKRRFRERCEARKLEKELGITDPTWDELYGMDSEPKPFTEFFTGVDPNDPDAYLDMPTAVGGEDFFGTFAVDDTNKWGGYIGGGSGYMNQPAAGGYQTGGYMS